MLQPIADDVFDGEALTWCFEEVAEIAKGVKKFEDASAPDLINAAAAGFLRPADFGGEWSRRRRGRGADRPWGARGDAAAERPDCDVPKRRKRDATRLLISAGLQKAQGRARSGRASTQGEVAHALRDVRSRPA